MEILDDLLAKMFSFGCNVVILMWTYTLWFVKMQIKKNKSDNTNVAESL